MPVGAGKLDRRCTFQKQVRVSDGSGGYTINWTDQFTVWGGLELPRMSARMEAIAAGAVQSAIGAEMTVRDTSDTRLIDHTWRVTIETDQSVSPTVIDYWNVRSVQPRDRSGFLRLAVERGVPL